MKCFIESTWAPWVPMPNTIQGVHAIGKNHSPDADLRQQILEFELQGQVNTHPHELDYLTLNSDQTKSTGYYVTDQEKAQIYVNWRKNNLSPGQIESTLVIITEPGDDPSLAKLGYGSRLDAGIIDPYY